MSTFNLIVLIILVSLMVVQMVAALQIKSPLLAAMFGFEICAFAYLARVLM
jgi:hypothetical protein